MIETALHYAFYLGAALLGMAGLTLSQKREKRAHARIQNRMNYDVF